MTLTTADATIPTDAAIGIRPWKDTVMLDLDRVIAKKPALEAHGFSNAPHFRDAYDATTSSERLRAIRRAAPKFREWLRDQGEASFVRTVDLQPLPYPTDFAFFRAPVPATPFVTILNRMIVVRFMNGGTRRTLLFSPSDVEMGRGTPFFARLSERFPRAIENVVYPNRNNVLGALEKLGIAPSEVDYLAFDHLHTQDVRRLVGTKGPVPGLSPDGPLAPWFPNAKLIVQKAELALLRDVHPIQAPWYQPSTYADVREDAYLVIEGDVVLGQGVALAFTPGHTPGNMSLVVNTKTGLWVSSENVVATECLTPEHSRIPGMRGWTDVSGEELVMNGNTMETRAEQYDSLVKEKLIADVSQKDARFVQFFPSSELQFSALNPLVRPTFSHGGISQG